MPKDSNGNSDSTRSNTNGLDLLCLAAFGVDDHNSDKISEAAPTTMLSSSKLALLSDVSSQRSKIGKYGFERKPTFREYDSPDEFFPKGSVNYEVAKSFFSWAEGGHCILNWKNDLPLALCMWQFFIQRQRHEQDKEVADIHHQAVERVIKIRQNLISMVMSKNTWEELYEVIDVVIGEILKNDQSSEGNVGVDRFSEFVQYNFYCYHYLGISYRAVYGLY